MNLKLFFYLWLSLGIHLAWMIPSLRPPFFRSHGEQLWVVERLKGNIPSVQQKKKGGSPSRAAGLLGTIEEITRQNLKPPYPMMARKLGLEGTATVEVNVSPSGTIKKIIFKRSSGHAILDRAIMRTVTQWTIPHHRNQDFWLTLPPFEFRLEKNAQAQSVNLAGPAVH